LLQCVTETYFYFQIKEEKEKKREKKKKEKKRKRKKSSYKKINLWKTRLTEVVLQFEN